MWDEGDHEREGTQNDNDAIYDWIPKGEPYFTLPINLNSSAWDEGDHEREGTQTDNDAIYDWIPKGESTFTLPINLHSDEWDEGDHESRYATASNPWEIPTGREVDRV